MTPKAAPVWPPLSPHRLHVTSPDAPSAPREGASREGLQQFGAQCFFSLIMVHTVSTHDIKLNQKQNRIQVAEGTNSERPGSRGSWKRGVLSVQSNKMSVCRGGGGVGRGVRVSKGECVGWMRVRKGDEGSGSALKRRPTGWLCALHSDGKVTGLKAQVQRQLFGLWGCCIGVHKREDMDEIFHSAPSTTLLTSFAVSLKCFHDQTQTPKLLKSGL